MLGAVAFAVPGPDMKFTQIGVDNGLSHATVWSMAQDAKGYMWVGTSDGLNRYDGYNFKIYRHEADKEESLPSDFVKRISFDPIGRMWVSGDGYLSLYKPITDSFVNYTFPDRGYITDILPVDTTHILIGTTRGVSVFDVGTGSFTPKFKGRRIDKPVVSFTLSGTTLYIAMGYEGMMKVDLVGGVQNEVLKEKGVYVTQVLADGESLLLATEGHGIWQLNGTTGNVEHVYRAGGHEGLGSDYVRSMAMDSDMRVWVGTLNGLDILDADRRAFNHYDARWNDAESLSHPSVRRLFADNQGGMWLGTYFNGLNYYHPLRNQFQTMRHNPLAQSLNDNVVGVIVEDTDGTLWVATNNGGLNHINHAMGKYDHYTKQNGLLSNDVKAIFIDPEDKSIYIGAHLGGMSKMRPGSNHVINIESAPRNVYDIEPSNKEGSLWIAALDRLVCYDKRTGIATDVAANGMTRITDLFRDSHGRLWVSGEDGLTVFEEDKEGRLTIASGVAEKVNGTAIGVNSVCETRGCNAYLISTNEGLIVLDALDGTLKTFTISNGMPNNMVYGVLEDAGGNLWCSTNLGIAMVDVDRNIVRTYSARDGLQGNQFNAKSFLRSTSGLFYFGGINGLTYFNPSNIETNLYSPAPIISGLRVFNETVTPGDAHGLIDRQVSDMKEIKFRPGQSVFTIDYSVCNFVAGQHNTFSYILEGADKQWTTTDAPGSVTFSNLPAGSYRFRLRSANNDGVPSTEEATLGIIILPQWYQTWWAILLFVLLFVGIVALVGIYLWQRKSRREWEKMVSVDRERRNELNEMKVRFFINMSHELRTPLTLILLPVRELLQQVTDRKTVQKLTIVKNNAERILHIVNQLLDYRRAEMGMFKLKVEPVHLNELVGNVFANYEYQAQRQGIDYRFETLEGDDEAFVDPHYIELICNNLISNAVKYTPRGQKITLALHRAGNELTLSVADTGCGIPADKLPEIFNRFYMVDDHQTGSGIGLSLVKRLVELHHGSVKVESKIGEGSVFTVVIPVEKSSYTDEETATETHTEQEVKPPLDLPPELPDSEISEQDLPEDEERDTILVVDDNPEILKYMCEGLSAEFNVLPAANGSEAIEALSGRKVDLIVTDIMMPDIDGVQLCRTVKRNLRTSHIPVIMLSAKSDESHQIEGFKVGADDYITKPFSMKLLTNKVKNLLRTRRQTIRHFSGSALDKPETVTINPLDEEFLRKAIDVMEKHLADADFTTDAYAGEMCMSRSNLHLKMKALTGESTNEFIRSFRMHRALELLKTARYTISQVSLMVGYSNPSYFTTTFKKFYGQLPSAYLKTDN